MIRPRQLVFRGHVLAHGVWVHRALVGESQARRRVLEQVGQGVRVLETPQGYLVQWSEPRTVRAEELPGGAVMRRGNTWHALPLRDDEFEALAPPANSFVFVDGGEVHTVPSSKLRGVDLADWVELPPLEILEATPCTRPVIPALVSGPRFVAEDAPQSAREALGAEAPAASDDRQRLLEALAIADPSKPADREPLQVAGARPSGLMDALATWLARMAGPSSAKAIVSAGHVGTVGPTFGASSRPRPPAKPGFLQRALARWIGASPLSAVIGHRQARFVEQTLRMFERGQWDEALRHAIPFGKLPGAPLPPSLRVPKARAELRLQAAAPASARSSLNLGDELYARFKELYAKAAAELERQGRIEKAAYVLFDLLGDDEKGIALLERHDKYELAARMAEGRGLDPGLVIRLWFLAGDPAAAIRVARRSGAFADAISRLEATHPDLAGRLRVLWADRLAGAGDFSAAVDAIWPEPSARRLAHRWIDLAIEFGGPPGMRMLARKLELRADEPEALSEVGRDVLALLDRDDDEARDLRTSLAQGWLEISQPWPAAARALGRALVRRLFDDGHHRQFDPSARDLVRELRDPLLSLDTPTVHLDRVDEVKGVHGPVFSRHERGLHPISDAIQLANGRLLLAHGDAGVRMVDGRGRVLRRYERPVQRLVVSDSGNQAIGVFTRGEVHSLSRFDLVTGRAEHWCEARFDSFVDSYDGASWFVTTEDALVAIDAQAQGFDALWRVGQIQSPLVAVARDREQVGLAVHRVKEGALEIWRYQLTTEGPVLRSRAATPLPHPEEPAQIHASLAPNGRVAARLEFPGSPRPADAVGLGPANTTLSASDPPEGQYIARGASTVLVTADAEAIELRGLSSSSLTAFEGGSLRLEGSTRVQVRAQAEHLLVSDDLGRVVHVDGQFRVLGFWLI